jgi:DNA-binding transcriptional LysR family regulator
LGPETVDVQFTFLQTTMHDYYMIDLRRLQVLRAVARHGTVTAAAHSLHLTPSAASQQLKQLSRELGVALLQPQGRRVRLTPAAHVLLEHAEALHTRWEQARAELHSCSEGPPSGPLRMAGFPTAVSGLLAPAAARIRDDCPGIAPRVSELETAAGFEALLADEIDIAVVVAGPGTPSLTDRRYDQQPLVEDPLDLLVPAGHRLAGRASAALRELAEDPWVVPAPGSCDHRDVVMVACAAAGFSPDVTHHAVEWSATCALVAHGLGIALIPRLVAVPAGHLTVRIPLRAAPARHLLTAVREGSSGHPLIGEGLRTLRELAGQGSPAFPAPAGTPA